MANLFNSVFKNFILFLSISMLFSCGEEQEKKLSKNEFIDPIKIDSLIDANYFIKREYVLNTLESVFDFKSKIAKCEIEKFNIHENNSGDEPEESWAIAYNFNNKVNSIKSESFGSTKSFKMIYDSKGRLIAQINVEDNQIYDEINETIILYEYYENNNLKSELFLDVKDKHYVFDEYKEYEYEKYNGGVLVTEKYISDSYKMVIKKSTLIFDNKGRRTSCKVDVIRDDRIFGSSSSQTNYFYDNNLFPNKVSKIDLTYIPSNEKKVESFKFDKKGFLIEKKDVSVIAEDIRKFNYSNGYKNLKVTYDYIPKLKKYSSVGIVVDNSNEIHTFEEYTFNLSNNKIVDFYDSKSYLKKSIDYKFDENTNWVEKKINNEEIIPKKLKKQYPNMEVYKFLEYFKRKISYTDFEKPFSINLINLKEVSKIKKEKKEEFENLKTEIKFSL